ncbi:MAG: Ca-activated chloride channel family protein [Salibacteraceae bacterium]|jgi:Ca-activated chloride channel family protein
MGHNNNFSGCIFLICFLFGTHLSWAQNETQQLTRILFIYDASNSMNGQWEGQSKHTTAKNLLNTALDSLNGIQNLQVALRVYGHSKSYLTGQECDDTKLEVPFSYSNFKAIKSKLKEIRPKGTTPIALSLERSGNDFPYCKDCRNIIILITDGIEECNGDPCAVSLALQKNGIILKPFVIGLGLKDDFKEQFKCVGNYFDVTSPRVFSNVLDIVISQALNATTAQINLLDSYENPTETNISMMLVNPIYNEVEYHYMHTMNSRGNPDTLYIDPSVKYDLNVYTVPMIVKKDVQVSPAIHNIIAVDAPQGTLSIYTNTRSVQAQPIAIVRVVGTMETIYAQPLGTTQDYLVGTYDLEIMTLPRTYLKGVEVNQSTTTKIELPNTGQVSLIRGYVGYGAIFVKRNGNLEWVLDLNKKTKSETIRLLPGNYKVMYRAKMDHNSKNTKWKDFYIRSGVSTSIRF